MVEPLPVGRLQSQQKRVQLKRWVAAFFSSHRTLITILWIVAFCSVLLWQRNSVVRAGISAPVKTRSGQTVPKMRAFAFNLTDFGGVGDGLTVNTTAFETDVSVISKLGERGGGQLNVPLGKWLSVKTRSGRPVPKIRAFAFNLTDFGGVGDGVTVNTAAFETAVSAISKLGERGGGQLNVPPGKWLTAPFNLTSHMTLFLAEDAEVLGIQDEKQWPLMPPLPSYGHGREHHGPRYGSLIHGRNLKDVVITGHNGTINGQGHTWWKKYSRKLLNHTRGPLVQIMWSSDIVIANITLRDSPFWTFHPYDCKNVTVRNVTILAPIHGAPNTDGIDPDSCEDVVIEDCYISVGDDAIAIKSGWDQYGIAYGRPSRNILVRNLIVRSMVSAGISIGSEMSGGVSDVTVENLLVWSSRRAVRIKTAAGRGGYIRHITYRNLTFDNVRVGIIMKTDYNEHPDNGFDPKALPIVKDISFTGVHGQGVRVPVRIHGSEDIPIRNVTFRDISVRLTYKKKHIFQCGFVQGRVIGTIFPAPCENLDLYNEEGQLVKRSVAQNITDVDYDI